MDDGQDITNHSFVQTHWLILLQSKLTYCSINIRYFFMFNKQSGNSGLYLFLVWIFQWESVTFGRGKKIYT